MGDIDLLLGGGGENLLGGDRRAGDRLDRELLAGDRLGDRPFLRGDLELLLSDLERDLFSDPFRLSRLPFLRRDGDRDLDFSLFFFGSGDLGFDLDSVSFFFFLTGDLS